VLASGDYGVIQDRLNVTPNETYTYIMDAMIYA